MRCEIVGHYPVFKGRVRQTFDVATIVTVIVTAVTVDDPLECLAVCGPCNVIVSFISEKQLQLYILLVDFETCVIF